MTAPVSAVDICNIALDHIGELPISSIESPVSRAEQIMARQYDHVRRACLRKAMWNFALAFRTITVSGDGAGGYANAFLLPNDCVRLNYIGTDPVNADTDFQISDRYIYSNSTESLTIAYNKDFTEVSKMDPMFIQYFALKLAEATVFALTKKRTLVADLKTLADEALKDAASVDGQERTPTRVDKSRLITARRRMGGIGSDSRYYE